jgi:hypothetical protein
MAAHRIAKARPIQLQLSLQLTREHVVPEVRAWVDVALAEQLQCELELRLIQRARWVWRGEFSMRDSGPFLYRLAIRAHAGAQWSLRFEDRAQGRCLLSDCDELGVGKCHLVGSVELPDLSPPRRWSDALILARDLPR